MSFRTFLINLDRATARRAHMEAQLDDLGLTFTRIPAVLGEALPDPVEGFDSTGYTIRTGKKMNKGEIGCYFSHLKTLKAFLATDADHALILEDDAELPGHLPSLLEAALSQKDKWDLLRLSSSRTGVYIDLANLGEGFSLGINTRVLKNTAAYLVNRHAAERCLCGLRPMRLPYDVALDRDWTMGFTTACIVPFPVATGEFPGQIAKAPRVRFFRATTFHLFHLIDRFRRTRYRRKVARQIRPA